MTEVLGSKGEEENESTVVHGTKEEEENESGGIVGLKRKEEKEVAKYSTAALPLGFMFRPTDEQLINHYLRLKNKARHSEVQIIAEVDFFNHHPWDLPGLSIIKSEDCRWYFFCLEKNPRDKQRKPGRGGFWKQTGKTWKITSSKGLIGERMSYFWQPSTGSGRIDWMMQCYRAIEAGSTRQNAFDLYVLVKIRPLKPEDMSRVLPSVPRVCNLDKPPAVSD